MLHKPKHHPKGSMCMNCKYAKRDCSSLPFETYPVLKREEAYVTVMCKEFSRND